ncbi:MAG: histidine kinase [Chitinophagaceae bacterium]|nr:histidine kinase [Chitinophagaceae bacterium]
MTRSAILLTYISFFFFYFFGFSWLASMNAGVAFQWRKQFEPFDISFYIYTLLVVLLAHFVVFRTFYYTRPRWKLWAALIALLVFFILFRYLLEEIIYPVLIGEGNYNPITTFRFYVIDNVYYGSIKIFIGFVLFLFDELFRNQRQKADLLQQNKEAEMNFLLAQMNPHFLFNSLNNIYSLAYEQHPQTAASVLKLSDMMRYVTYEKEKKVELKKELDYVRNLIDIQQLRHDHKLNVRIEAPEEVLSCKVMPLLLIPLVENALKHGDMADPSAPLLITLLIAGNKVEIKVCNKISVKQPEITGGVGLKNLKRRLELSYRPGEYYFGTEQIENIFYVKLIIPLD